MKGLILVFHLRLLRCIPVFNYLRRCDIPLREIRRSEGMAVSCIFLLIALWNWFSRSSLNCNRVWGQMVSTDSNRWVKIMAQAKSKLFWWNISSGGGIWKLFIDLGGLLRIVSESEPKGQPVLWLCLSGRFAHKLFFNCSSPFSLIKFLLLQVISLYLHINIAF